MATSEHTCGDCGFVYEIDLDGDHIQPCPRCGFQEMVKKPRKEDVKMKDK